MEAAAGLCLLAGVAEVLRGGRPRAAEAFQESQPQVVSLRRPCQRTQQIQLSHPVRVGSGVDSRAAVPAIEPGAGIILLAERFSVLIPTIPPGFPLTGTIVHPTRSGTGGFLMGGWYLSHDHGRKICGAMANLKLVALGQDGISYIRDCLAQSGVLSSALSRSIGFEGRAYAPLPEGTSTDRAKMFEAGGLGAGYDPYDWLEEHILSWRQRHGQERQVVFEDAWMKATYPEFQESKLKKLAHDTGVYYVLDDADLSESSIREAVRSVANFLVIGAIVSPTVLSNEQIAAEIMDDSLADALARNTQEIFVGAYDQEGYVVWERAPW